MAARWYGELDATGRKTFWSCYVGFSLDSMNIQIYAFLLPGLLTLWTLTPSVAGLLATAALVAGSAGGWLAGSLSDRLGRARVLRFSILWMAVSTALCGLSQNYEQLLFARVVQGLGFGAEWAVGIVLMSEIATPESRGRVVGTVMSAWDVGWALAAGTTAAATALLPPDIGWRASFFLSLVPAAALVFVRWKLPEPAAFTAKGADHVWHGIFSPNLCPTTIKGCLLAIGMHGGYWAIATWWPTMLRFERGLSPGATSLHMAVLIAGSFLGYISGAWLSDRVGRRATIGCFATGGIAIILFATRLPLSNLALLALTAPLGLFALGIYSAVGPLLAELYPTNLRGSGLGFCYNVGRGIAGAVPLAVGGSIAQFGYSHAIGFSVIAAYLLVLIITLLLAETRGTRFIARPKAEA
jgi:MFS family permease